MLLTGPQVGEEEEEEGNGGGVEEQIEAEFRNGLLQSRGRHDSPHTGGVVLHRLPIMTITRSHTSRGTVDSKGKPPENFAATN